MDLNDLNFLPEWDDERFGNAGEESEAWKNTEANQAAKALYEKWRETYTLIYAFLENLAPEPTGDDPETHEQLTRRLIYDNAIIIGPKLRGAMSVDLYILKMENASIIRTNAKQLMEQVRFAVMMDFTDESYKNVIEESMSEFRTLFKEWVCTFKKDEFEDEWGLY